MSNISEIHNQTNTRIYERNIPQKPLQPYLDVRPVMTKYSYLPIVDPRKELHTKFIQLPTYNSEQNFNPGNTQSPWSGFASNINKESELRNQIYALQKCSQSVYVPSANTGVVINKTQSSTFVSNTTLDVSGNVNISGNFYVSKDSSFNSNLFVNKISFLSNISERKVTTSIGTDLSCNLDYSQGSVFYLGSTAPTGNMRFNVINIPSITDLSNSYLMTVIYKGGASNYYGNVVTLKQVGGTNSVSFTPNFSSTPIIKSGKLVTQTIGYLYFAPDTSYVISNVTCFQY